METKTKLILGAVVVVGILLLIGIVAYMMLKYSNLTSPTVTVINGTTITGTATVPATVTGTTKWVGKKVKASLSSVSATPLTGTIATATLSGTTVTFKVTLDTASATIAAASASKYAAASTDTIGIQGSIPST